MKYCIYVMRDFLLYIIYLGEIAYVEKDFVLSADYLQKSLELRISWMFIMRILLNFLPQALELADIINNPVKYNPKIIDGYFYRI